MIVHDKCHEWEIRIQELEKELKELKDKKVNNLDIMGRRKLNFYNIKILKKTYYDAIVFYPFVFFADTFENTSKPLLNHEYIHIMQIKKYGFFKYYYLYLKDYFKNLIKYKNHLDAYYNIKFEVEAYENEWNYNYKV
jgi:hypothetical protein